MKTVGIIGGIGPESTIEYYKQIIALYRELKPDGSYPLMIINNIDMKKMLDLIASGNLDEVAEYLSCEIEKLSKAGADFGLLASNTPHLVFNKLKEISPIPLISIVEETCKAADRIGLKKIGLMGTRFTMQGNFYKDVFSEYSIELAVPGIDDQKYIHDKYMNELVNGIVLPETLNEFLMILGKLVETDNIQGLILGGTELPLLFKNLDNYKIPILDTTRIHVESVVRRLLDY